MTITKTDIKNRIDSLKEWQETNSNKIHSDPHLEGYNSAVISEILFLENFLDEETPVVQRAAKTKTRK